MTELLNLLGVSTLIGSALIVISILLGQVTSKTGLPLLLIFLAIGMLAGEDGIGGIEFDNYQLAFWIGNIALAVILLDGGVRTPYSIFRVALKPSILLSTLGVILTCGFVTLAGALLFNLPWTLALLFGAIVASTDAAAVFGLLNSSGLKLNERVAATLEIESGLNDPMAVFLTILAITIILSQRAGESLSALGIAFSVFQQIGFAVGIGYIAGHLFTRLLRAVKIERSHNHGINALLIIACGMFVFGLATAIGGSGFLAIYIFGLVLGNNKTRFVKTIIPAMDGLAWLFQASMFLLLGLLATPHEVVSALGTGLGLSLFLIFVARPLAVFPCLYWFHYSTKEMLFISWVGLRGAVPIVLAIFPIMASVDPGHFMLSLSIMVVISSLLLQGTTLSMAANRLGMALPEDSDNAAVRKTFGSFELEGSAMVCDVASFYGIRVEHSEGLSLSAWISKQIGKPPVIGDSVSTGGVVFVVKEMNDSQIAKVGIKQSDSENVV
jgi:potassium/hydrogen antiporter